MAPFPLCFPRTQSYIQERQDGSSTYQITMTVIGPTTTCTTIINLNGATSIETGPPPPPTTSASLPTGSPSTRSQAAPLLVNPTDETSDSGVIAGAIIGSVCGFVLLLVILYLCCVSSYYRGWGTGSTSRSSRYYYSSQSSLGSYNGRGGSSRSSRLHFRGGGGGSSWESGSHRVKKPGRARVRGQRRSGMSESDSDAVSRSRKRRSGRRGSGTRSGGLAGWYFKSMGGGGASSRASTRESKRRRRDAWRDGRAKIQTLDT